MPYIGGKGFVFDFDSVKFPIELSENVKRYLYPEYRYGHFNRVEYEQFEKILNGEDRSKLACRVLSSLVEDTGYNRMPPANFDILEDVVTETKDETLPDGSFRYKTEYHSGQCKYDELVFDFTYSVEIHFENGEVGDLKRKETMVRMIGKTFEKTGYNMHVLCANYLASEQEAIEKLHRTTEAEKEMRRWVEFRLAHQQELIDWLSPIIKKPVRFHPCERIKGSVLRGYPEFCTVAYLDYGECQSCTGRCRFRKKLRERGEHSEEWYKLGIDKLGFKYIWGAKFV